MLVISRKLAIMKRIVLLIIFILGIQITTAQSKYDKLWKEVETFESGGMFKSANEVVNKIFKKAKRSSQGDQITKAIIYKSKFTLLLSEESHFKIISELESLIKESDFPTNAILESVYASYLEQYLDKNRYKIRKRTKVEFPFVSNDFEKWDINTFVFQIARHYELSLIQPEKLKKVSIKDYQAVITDSRTSHKFRPTLYDFLMHRALVFYKLDKWYLKQPTDQFYINNNVVFQPTEQFVQEAFYTTDSIYSNRNVLKIYQQLEQFHRIIDTMAYIDVVVGRLKFSKDNATIENKSDLYLNALKELSRDYENHEVSSLLNYHIANYYFKSSKQTNAKKDAKLKDFRIKALAFCNSAIEKYPNSDGGLLCTILKNNIEEQFLSVQTEKYVTPEKSFLAKVNFKSVDSLYISAYRIPYNYFENIYSYKKDSLVLEVIKGNEPVKSKFYKLQPKKNFYKYTTEIDLPSLPMGRYLIIASKKNVITSIDQVYNFEIITATHLSLLSIQRRKDLVVKILEREVGTPLKSVEISMMNSDKFHQEGKTNADGEFYLRKGQDYHNNLRLIAIHKGDTLLKNGYYLERKYKDNEDDDDRVAKMFLYLDRSIYRPGQTVFFKGLLVERKKGKSKAVPDTYTSIIIYDANGEELKEFRLKTNEYGSVSGEFSIPRNVLTGEFSIEMDEDYGDDNEDEDPYYEKVDDLEYSEVYFSVEEYKRPKFEVTFNKITENYTVGDSIKVSGLAKAFFGSTVSDAKVSYSVSRETILPRWNYNYYGSSSQIIATGTTQTDARGIFTTAFIAIPDSLSTKANKPIFLYTVEADITDSNGETRSASKIVKVGFHNLKVALLLANKLNASEPQQFRIETKNLNDQPVQADVEFAIYKVSSPKRVLRKKPWDIVELPYISKDEFLKLFPNEVYDSTDVKKHWRKGELVFSNKINTSKLNDVLLNDISKWQSGSYMLEIKAVGTFKDTISVNKNFEVYRHKDNFLSDSQLFDYEVVNSEFKEDSFVSINLKTASNNLHLNLEAYYKGELVFDKVVAIDKGSTLVRVPVSNDYKNKLDFNIYFVKFNSLHSDQFSVYFPEIEKELTIETISFRNKLTPDQKETWSFKILNSNNENADAEILASMYDASLDQFKEHSWTTDIGFNDYNYSYAPRVQANDFFGTTTFSSFKRPNRGNVISFIKNYHKLKWFGFNFGTISYENKKYLAALLSKLNNPKYIEGNISGIITDNVGLPLPGVNVIVKGTSVGTQTDFDGFYSINAPAGSELVFSYVGFSSISAGITKSGTFNIAMSEDAAQLEEVVITAMGIKKEKKALGYAVSYMNASDVSNDIVRKLEGKTAGVSIVQSNGLAGSGSQVTIRGMSSFSNNEQTLFIVDGVPMDDELGAQFSPNDIEDISVLKGEAAMALYGARAKNGVVIITTKKGIEALMQVEARSNLKETAFFFPHLKTNKNGEVIFSFDSPQALTKWRLMLFAHNKSLEAGGIEKTIVTQKDINVVPNAPRFLRENDVINLSAKISNLTKEPISGITALQLFNGITMQPIDNDLISIDSVQNFTISAQGNTSLTWELKIPEGIQAIQYKIVAKSGTHSDGETNVLPVLSNRSLITESKPLWVPAGKSQEVLFDKLQTPISDTQENHRFVIEYTSNPTWLAIKSLPYLMEFPHECAEQTFSRYYANVLADDIISKNPEIEAVFKSWKNNNSLQPSLEKNEELKSILISETPWVRDLQSDKDAQSRLANLFDKERLKEQQLQALSKLKELQMPSGGFPWFSGGNENTFITQHIVAGIGHLQKLNVQNENDYKLKPLLKKAIGYLDSGFVRQFEKSVQFSKDSVAITLNHHIIHYLYTRSFYLDSYPMSDKVTRIMDVYLDKSKRSWLTQSLYEKGLIAVTLQRNGDSDAAKVIIEALSEQAVISEDNGMYWKENSKSWYWYKSPIETQALLIEAFTEIEGESKKIERLKQWLLKNKQIDKWSSTKATTEAIYALLMHGNNWLSISDNTVIFIGDEKIKTEKLEATKKEAGTGYLKVNWNEDEFDSKMASVKVNNKNSVPGFGGAYWQYFEDLDKVTSSEKTPLRVHKALFVKKTSDDGETLIPITSNTSIALGDLITVRIEIVSENDMEFVHLKDLRASGLEPIDVLSDYKWQDGLGYYQSTKDVATHFFFDELPKGTYIFEYDLRANNSGNFSSGISTIQSMYAPEFMSNSDGIRLLID